MNKRNFYVGMGLGLAVGVAEAQVVLRDIDRDAHAFARPDEDLPEALEELDRVVARRAGIDLNDGLAVAFARVADGPLPVQFTVEMGIVRGIVSQRLLEQDPDFDVRVFPA